MPTRPTGEKMLRAVATVAQGAFVLLLMFLAGCRVLRSPKASDESIASARQLSLQAIAARGQGRWEQSEALFAQAVEQCPRDERARCGYAEALWQRGEQQQAVAHMEEAVRLSGHDPERLVQLGGMYLARGELTRAAAQADRAIAANRDLASAWALRGKVLQSQGKRTEALASFHRALTLQGQYPEVQLALAEIYREQGRPQRALTTLQSLADNMPPDQVPVEVLVQQGFALRQLGRHRDAARSLALAAGRGNPPVDLLYELGRSHLEAGDTAAARLAVNAALAREPSHAGCLALREQLATSQGTVAAALR
ncbi:MAG: tetratricopeptide repeat protein [Planctomycetaceae bacterium]|nr:tetratricopeptide repeat protein [Planctomycetaceae bacterium]